MDVYTPETIEEAQGLLSGRPNARALAGGTDLLVGMRLGRVSPSALVSLERISSMKRIEDRGDEIFIGASATHAMILASSLVRARAPLLARGIRELGSPQIRNMGTLGGNIVTASPAGDALPPLYVLRAIVEITGGDDVRRIPINEFISGPGAVNLLPGEIVTGVALPQGPTEVGPCDIVHYEKVGKRKALAIAVASLAAMIRISGLVVAEARLAWGSLGPMVVRSRAVEQALIGKPLTIETLRAAAAVAADAVSPISDVRAGKEYRRALAGNLLLRLASIAERG